MTDDFILEQNEENIIECYRNAASKKEELLDLAKEFHVPKMAIVEFLYNRGEMDERAYSAYLRHNAPGSPAKMTKEEFEAHKAALKESRKKEQETKPEEKQTEVKETIVIRNVPTAPSEVIALVTNKLASMEEQYRHAAEIVKEYEKLAKWVESVAATREETA